MSKRVWHKAWPGDRFGRCIAEYTTDQGHQYCWVVGPNANDIRPLTYHRDALVFVDKPKSNGRRGKT